MTHLLNALALGASIIGGDLNVTAGGNVTQAGALAPEQAADGEPAAPGRISLYTTGQLGALQAAAVRWLELPAHCCAALPQG